MELSQLRYFLAASKTLNYTKAADQCFTSRQNLTHAIRGFENELGVTLFARSGGALVLTIEGQEAARQIEGIVEAVDALAQSFSRAEDVRDTLDVLCGINVANCAPCDVLKMLDEYRGSMLHILEHGCKTCYEKILSMDADVAIVASMESDFPGCKNILLDRSPIYVLVSEESVLAGKDRIEMSDLATHKLLLLPEYEFQYGPFVAEYQLRHLRMDNINTISNIGFMLETVRRQDAVGIVSTRFTRNAPRGTIAKPFADSRMEMCIYAIYLRESNGQPSVKAFLEYVRGSFPSEPE